MSKISIIIPALNEEEAIEGVIRAIPKDELRGMGFDVQILVVDGNSWDKTKELASKAGAEVIIEPRRGYGRAYKTGFAKASGDIIATADADLTCPGEGVPKFVKLLRDENLEFITTNRFASMEKDAMSFRNRVGNGVLNLATRLLFHLNLKDSQSGMWVFRKDILDRVSFSEELKLEACHFTKCCWREMPINIKPVLVK